MVGDAHVLSDADATFFTFFMVAASSGTDDGQTGFRMQTDDTSYS